MDLRNSLKSIQTLRNLALWLRIKRESHSFTRGTSNSLRIEGIKVGSRIQISGSNNKLNTKSNSVLKCALISISGNNNELVIDEDAYIEGTVIHIEDNYCKVYIGKKTFIGPSHLAISEDGSQLFIGSNCMISSNVQIRTGDSHSVLDENRKRINHAASIFIADHVWLAEDCKIMKGVSIGSDSVVSTGSIVTKQFGLNQLIGGIPAKVLKENISWDEKRI